MATHTAFRYYTEIIDGVERELPTPKKLHIRIQNLILRLFFAAQDSYLEFDVMPALDVLLDRGRDYLVPDITVVRRNATYDNGMLHAKDALLCIEILSPGQTVDELYGKCELLFEAGCPVCWVIWGERRRGWICRPGNRCETADLRAETLPPAFWISLERLFADLGE